MRLTLGVTEQPDLEQFGFRIAPAEHQSTSIRHPGNTGYLQPGWTRDRLFCSILNSNFDQMKVLVSGGIDAAGDYAPVGRPGCSVPPLAFCPRRERLDTAAVGIGNHQHPSIATSESQTTTIGREGHWSSIFN